MKGSRITLNIRKRKSKSFDRVDNLILILIIDMKTLNLSSYDVEEMSETQRNEVNGGIFLYIAAAATVYCAVLAGAYYKGYYDAINEEVEDV